VHVLRGAMSHISHCTNHHALAMAAPFCQHPLTLSPLPFYHPFVQARTRRFIMYVHVILFALGTFCLNTFYDGWSWPSLSGKCNENVRSFVTPLLYRIIHRQHTSSL
jgi:hypothetical protein